MKYRKNHLIRYIASAFLLSLGMAEAHADRIFYYYDASGNRTYSQKEIIIRGNLPKDGDRAPIHHELSLHRITIYPNPTDGCLSVEITGEGTLEGASITIYSSTGSIIYLDSSIDEMNEIDLTQCQNGIYLLMIRIDGEISSRKIIKI